MISNTYHRHWDLARFHITTRVLDMGFFRNVSGLLCNDGGRDSHSLRVYECPLLNKDDYYSTELWDLDKSGPLNLKSSQHNTTLFKTHSSHMNFMDIFLLIPYKFNIGCRCVACNTFMMTSSNGKILRVAGHLCGEFTGPRWITSAKGQWRGALIFSLICVWINGWVNNREAGDLRRYCAHYDVTVMCYFRPRHTENL